MPGSERDKSDKGALTGTQTLMRGLTVLQAVADGAQDLKTLCLKTGIARSTAHRLAMLLVQERYLRSHQGQGYALGPRLIELGFQARASISLVDVARPYLQDLAAYTGDAVHLVVRDEDQALYLDKISSTRAVDMRSRVGSKMPLAYSGVGKALLLDDTEEEWHRLLDAGQPASREAPGNKGWDDFRKRMHEYVRGGYAYDLEDNEISIRCVAAPIRDASRKIVAGISVAGTVPFMSLERMQALQHVVMNTAANISGELGFCAASAKTESR